MIALNEALPKMKQKIARYKPMDQTGLFYCCAPNRTISRDPVEVLKIDKRRIKIAFTSNADGSHKFNPFLSVMQKSPIALEINQKLSLDLQTMLKIKRHG